jgi:hypothetical protein
MAIFAVPLETQVRKPSDATLRAKDSAAFIHEAEDLVVFSPHLYKQTKDLQSNCSPAIIVKGNEYSPDEALYWRQAA